MSELMEKHRKTFGVERPVIGCLHLQALPGTPYADPHLTLGDQIKRLRGEARTLVNAGFDAVVFANEGDRPYLTTVGPEVVANYVRIAAEVAAELTVPFGCGVLIDPIATLAVAKAIGARFVRTYVSNTYEGTFGTQSFCPGEIFRYQRQIGAEDVRVYTYFEPHAGTCLDARPSEDMLEAGVMNMPIAGALFGGAHAGLPPEASHVAQLKEQFPEVPILIGSGGTTDNIASLLPHSDGVIVGTSIKVDGVLWNPVDPARAEAFIKAAKS
jgi:membrane complex biogenesis BtpA family protein